jgi:uncharacterized membrane protein YedE/YeeE
VEEVKDFFPEDGARWVVAAGSMFGLGLRPGQGCRSGRLDALLYSGRLIGQRRLLSPMQQRCEDGHLAI